MNLAQAVRNRATEMVEESPVLRWGQAVFNALYEIKPDLADHIRGTPLDPFHDDNKAHHLLTQLSGLEV